MKELTIDNSEITEDELDESSDINKFRNEVNEYRSNHPDGYVNEEPIKSLSEYFKYLDCVANKTTWYRGEPKEYEFLTPSLYRNINDIEIPEYLELERDFFYEFQRKANAFGASVEGSDKWETYFLIQHYGGPTRLLDWTQNAAMGLFFALDSNRKSDENPIVLMLHPKVLSHYALSEIGVEIDYTGSVFYPGEGPTEKWLDNLAHRLESTGAKLPSTPIALFPSYRDRRIFSQSSCFTLFGDRKNGFFEKDKPLTCKCCDQRIVSKIIIDGKSKDKIRNQLKTIGITRSKVYPDLEGLCRELVEDIMESNRNKLKISF